MENGLTDALVMTSLHQSLYALWTHANASTRPMSTQVSEKRAACFYCFA